MNSMCATPIFVMMRSIGRGNFRQRRNFAGMIHSDFPDRDFIPRCGLQNCSRQADVIVEISFRFRDSKSAGEHRCSKIFRARLAVASGDRDHLQRERFSVIGREILVRLQRVACANKREILRNFPVPIRVNDRASRTACCDGFDEIVSIEIFTAQRDEQFAGLNRSRIGADLSTTTAPSPDESEPPANCAIWESGSGFIMAELENARHAPANSQAKMS